MKFLPWAAIVAATVWTAPIAVAETLEESRDWHRPGDYARALEFFFALACQGNAAAQESLGAMYESGRGTPRDYVQAYQWMSLALAQASGEVAIRRRAILAAIEAKMTPDEIAEARSRTRVCTSRKDHV